MSSPPNDSELLMESSVNLFEEPPSSDDEPEYAIHTYTRVEPIRNNKDIKEFSVRLPQKHSLWAHLAWNAGIALSDYFDQEVDFTGKNVLELGSGAGLPAFVAALNNSKKVVLTDYPEEHLINNIRHNVLNTIDDKIRNNRVYVEPHLWGKEPEKLFSLLEDPTSEKYDIIILSDLIFNHVVHEQMLKTCAACLSKDGVVYVSFTHHRPSKLEKDLDFFKRAEEDFHFQAEKFKERKMTAMFAVDLGPEEIRSMVHFYTLKWKSQ
eukprot:gene5658-7044_t